MALYGHVFLTDDSHILFHSLALTVLKIKHTWKRVLNILNALSGFPVQQPKKRVCSIVGGRVLMPAPSVTEQISPETTKGPELQVSLLAWSKSAALGSPFLMTMRDDASSCPPRTSEFPRVFYNQL